MNRFTTHITESAGFTLIELLIAMAVSSAILLAATAGFVQISRMYRHGVAQANTQNLTRNTIEAISRPIQFSVSDPIAGTPRGMSGGVNAQSICIGSTRFSYVLGQALADNNDLTNHQIKHVLWQDTITDITSCQPLDLTQDNPSGCDAACNSDTGGSADRRELVAHNTRLTTLSVNKIGNSNVFDVSIRAIYGDDGVLDNPAATTPNCQGGFLNAQACAVSALTTQVEKRL